MTLTPEQVGIAFTIVMGLLVALTQYLTRLATKKDIKALHGRVADLHADVTAKKPTLLRDGHELPPRG